MVSFSCLKFLIARDSGLAREELAVLITSPESVGEMSLISLVDTRGPRLFLQPRRKGIQRERPQQVPAHAAFHIGQTVRSRGDPFEVGRLG
jgi:hypothetical protein